MMTKLKLFWIVIPVLLVAVLVAVSLKYGWIVPQEKESTEEAKDEEVKVVTITPADACINQGEKQQFTASVDDVAWSVASLTSDPLIGSIDQDGLFTANGSAFLGKVTASKEGLRGYAGVVVIPKGQVCNATGKINKPSDKIVKDGSKTGEVPIVKDKSFESNMASKWAVNFDVDLKYEVNNGFEEVGYVTYNLDGGFFFTIDYATGELKLKEPAGFVEIKVSDDIVSCETTIINDPFMFISETDGKLVDTDLVFGKNFIASDYKEGIEMSCLNSNFSDPNASVIDLIGQYAFPVTVEAADKATAPIQGSFSFANGRQATINGTVTIYRVDL